MEASNYNNVFLHPIQEKKADFLSKGIFLWVINWKIIPPHLACSENGRYFSLSTNGIKRDVDATIQFRNLRQKNIPSFFIRLSEAVMPIETAFDKSYSIGNLAVSCLTPLKVYLLQEHQNIEIVSDLLRQLNTYGKIVSAHSVNSPEGFCGIRNYSIEVVHKHISKLLQHETVE